MKKLADEMQKDANGRQREKKPNDSGKSVVA